MEAFNRSEKIYDYLERETKKKGYRRESRETKDQLLIDKTVLKDCKKKHTNLSMAWIEYKKEHDFFPHSWINESMELFGTADNVRSFWKRLWNNGSY